MLRPPKAFSTKATYTHRYNFINVQTRYSEKAIDRDSLFLWLQLSRNFEIIEDSKIELGKK